MTAEVFVPGLVGWAATAAFFLLLAAMALAFVRIAIGPSFADRVVGIDLLTILLVAVCAVYAIKVDEPAFLDIAISLALVAFLGTVALARYAGRRNPPANQAADPSGAGERKP
ncbi:MAG TPA: monovalent cation/H+ antiporter complex subunit F [Rhodospirillales bacterium]|nr:monovalent cation/H+ antiporter complex subunit F [Rhodospirillales bacterium]